MTLEINGMKEWDQLMSATRQDVAEVAGRMQQRLSTVEQAPVNAAMKDAFREYAGAVSALEQRADDLAALARQADEDKFREFVDGGLDNADWWAR